MMGDFGVVEWATGRETFVQVGRWQEECVMGFSGRSRVRSDREGEMPDPDLDLDPDNTSILPRRSPSPPI